ncbi:hypothetical protein Tsubulata_027678 [Turnera subulata]|uniref:Protein EARLY FLOWERING 3 n=1 Tax=Turnera subulata TaxID=218843 RepID=A0A9Q0F2X8_9ROSI|nr:hypothetical protein Tsubulata_027678 [Turnera subulata]
MRGPKDEEKLMAPMFPRLHVNDTERGGPRAPPRNKMALYEQLSIPSQRLSSGTASILPFPPSNGDSLASPVTSNHGGGYEKRFFTQFCNSSVPSKREKLVSYSSGGVDLGVVVGNEELSSSATNDQNSITLQPQLSAKSSSSQSQKKSSWKKFGDENDFKVPRSSQSGVTIHRSNSQLGKDHETRPYLNFCFSVQLQKAYEKQNKGTGFIDLSTLSPACQDAMEGSVSVPLIKDKVSLDGSANLPGKFRSTEPLKRVHPFSNQEWRTSPDDVLKNFHGKENNCKGRSESYSRLSPQDSSKNLNGLGNGIKNREDNKCGSLQKVDTEKHDDVSETSMVDSVSALDLTPDDVVAVIGEKQFWKARRAFVNQQRVFAVQVFELHRLLTVQKLIAGSPRILLGDKVCIGKASVKASQQKKLLFEHAMEQPSLIAKPKDYSQKLHPRTEFADENVVRKLPLPSLSKESSKEFIPQRSSYNSQSGSAPPIPMVANAKPLPWCFPQPGNQWLVPVMSPSEGLVYKPYTGPCPPAAGFMAPAYGNFAPTSLKQQSGDIFSASYGVPPHHQGHGILPGAPPFAQTHFPPYGMPVMNLSSSGSAVEPINPFTGPKSKGSQLSVGDTNNSIPRQSLYSISSQTSQAISPGFRKFQASKDTEVQGSSGSNSSDRAKGDALPLFPTEPSVQASDQNSESNGLRRSVIKVVPHNRRSATESAARIFRSIQEERKQFD